MVDHAIFVAVEFVQCLEAVRGERAVGEPGEVAEEFVTSVDSVIAVPVEHEKAVAGGVDTVAVQLKNQKSDGGEPVLCALMTAFPSVKPSTNAPTATTPFAYLENRAALAIAFP